jgi:hypothetical protein
MIKTGNVTHDNNIYLAEMARQVANAGMPTQATARSNDIADYRARVTSGRANNCDITVALTALRELGVGQ